MPTCKHRLAMIGQKLRCSGTEDRRDSYCFSIHRWVAKRWKSCANLRTNVLAWSKSLQVHASSSQTGSQVIARLHFQTCNDVRLRLVRASCTVQEAGLLVAICQASFYLHLSSQSAHANVNSKSSPPGSHAHQPLCQCGLVSRSKAR